MHWLLLLALDLASQRLHLGALECRVTDEGSRPWTPPDPLEQRIEAHWLACRRKARSRGVMDEWWSLCERELTSFNPVEYPPLDEIIPRAR